MSRCNEVIDVEETNFNEKNITCKTERYEPKKPNILLLNDIINIENFDPNNIKTDEKSYKNILMYYIGYVTTKGSKYIKIYSINPLYLIFGKVKAYFE